jgi:phage gp29-like protein
MTKRFKVAPVPTGEMSSYVSSPFNLSALHLFGSSNPFTGQGASIVRPSDDLLISKGGGRALSVYQRLFFDEHVQSSFSKLTQEITSRAWYLEEYSSKPGDLAVRDYVAELLNDLPLDELYKGLAEALIVGFSAGEVIWKKTKKGVIPIDIRMRDQRRFVFQESEEAQTGFTMRCLTYNKMFEGIELPARKFIVNRHWSTHNGDPYGMGIGRMLYPLVKFRRRAIESYVLYGDRYATPTTVVTAPLSASNAEIDAMYALVSNLSQETAVVLPEGFRLDSLQPDGRPEVFKELVDYIDKEISLLICGENEAGQAEAGSRASSQVANTVRVVKASELSEMISQTLTRTLVRWIVDLNFGIDVAAPTLHREFRIEESSLSVSDVSMLIQSGYTPKKEWIERHFRVELEEELEAQELDTEEELEAGSNGAVTTYNPQEDESLFEDIFGDVDQAADSEITNEEDTPEDIQEEEVLPDNTEEEIESDDPEREPAPDPGEDLFDSVFGSSEERAEPPSEEEDLFEDIFEGDKGKSSL